eukprot:3446769-Rhodomonas_salina.1
MSQQFGTARIFQQKEPRPAQGRGRFSGALQSTLRGASPFQHGAPSHVVLTLLAALALLSTGCVWTARPLSLPSLLTILFAHVPAADIPTRSHLWDGSGVLNFVAHNAVRVRNSIQSFDSIIASRISKSCFQTRTFRPSSSRQCWHFTIARALRSMCAHVSG